jgi:hypothetical protein
LAVVVVLMVTFLVDRLVVLVVLAVVAVVLEMCVVDLQLLTKGMLAAAVETLMAVVVVVVLAQLALLVILARVMVELVFLTT